MKYAASKVNSGRRFFRVGTAKVIMLVCNSCICKHKSSFFKIIFYPIKNIPWTFMEDNKWKGYCIDLIEKLAKEMNFKYELVVKDAFGEVDPITNKWNGLIGGLVEGVND